MNSFKNVFDKLGKKKFWSLTFGLLLPVTMLALLIVFAPTTGCTTLFLMPFVTPFLAANMQKVWYAMMGLDDSQISSASYSYYYRKPGLYGGLGLLGPTILSVIIGMVFFFVVFSLTIESLMGAFGQHEVYEELMAMMMSGSTNEAIDYMAENISAFNGPLIVMGGISLFVGLVSFLLMFLNSAQGYVFFQRAMPDADINIMGSQSKALGKVLLKGTFLKRFRKNWFALTLTIVLGALIQGAFIAVFSLIPTDYPYLMSALPAAISMILLTPLFTIIIASNVPTADAMIPYVVGQCDPRIIDEMNHFYSDPNYRHSEENKNKRPFQDASGQSFTINVSESSPSNDFFVPENEQAPAKEESEQEQKEEGPSFGFFDFGDDKVEDKPEAEEKKEDDTTQEDKKDD